MKNRVRRFLFFEPMVAESKVASGTDSAPRLSLVANVIFLEKSVLPVCFTRTSPSKFLMWYTKGHGGGVA